jgi:hypothetical protein
MDKRLSALASALTSSAAKAWKFVIDSMRMQIAIDVHPYRPEKYYMRGPGPAWRAKHSHEGAHAGSFYR